MKISDQLCENYRQYIKDHLYRLPVNNLNDYENIKNAVNLVLHGNKIPHDHALKKQFKKIESFFYQPQKHSRFPKQFKEIVVQCLSRKLEKIALMTVSVKQDKIEKRHARLVNLNDHLPYLASTVLEASDPTLLRQCNQYCSSLVRLVEAGIPFEEIVKLKPRVRRDVFDSTEIIVDGVQKGASYGEAFYCIRQRQKLIDCGITYEMIFSLDKKRLFFLENASEISLLLQHGCNFRMLQEMPAERLQPVLNHVVAITNFIKQGVFFEAILSLEENLFKQIFDSPFVVRDLMSLFRRGVTWDSIVEVEENVRTLILKNTCNVRCLIRTGVSFDFLMNLRHRQLVEVIKHGKIIANLLGTKKLTLENIVNLKKNLRKKIFRYWNKLIYLFKAGISFKEIIGLNEPLRCQVIKNGYKIACLLNSGIPFVTLLGFDGSYRTKIFNQGDKIADLIQRDVLSTTLERDDPVLSLILKNSWETVH